MKPMLCKYVLQNRQGQFSGTHRLTLSLNSNIVSVSFIRIQYFLRLGPKYDRFP